MEAITLNSIGICMGSSKIKVIKTKRNSNNLKIVDFKGLLHEDSAVKTLEKILAGFNLD